MLISLLHGYSANHTSTITYLTIWGPLKEIVDFMIRHPLLTLMCRVVLGNVSFLIIKEVQSFGAKKWPTTFGAIALRQIFQLFDKLVRQDARRAR